MVASPSGSSIRACTSASATLFRQLRISERSGFGYGIEKLPDLNHVFSFFGNYWYYPNADGNFTDPFNNGYTVAYRVSKYQVGVNYVLAGPLFLDLGWIGNSGNNKSGAPISYTRMADTSGSGSSSKGPPPKSGNRRGLGVTAGASFVKWCGTAPRSPPSGPSRQPDPLGAAIPPPDGVADETCLVAAPYALDLDPGSGKIASWRPSLGRRGTSCPPPAFGRGRERNRRALA